MEKSSYVGRMKEEIKSKSMEEALYLQLGAVRLAACKYFDISDGMCQGQKLGGKESSFPIWQYCTKLRPQLNHVPRTCNT